MAAHSFAEANEVPPDHIPAFLPALPDAHTYKQTETFEGQAVQPAKAKLKQYSDGRQANTALLGLLNGTTPNAPANYLAVMNSQLWENQSRAPPPVQVKLQHA